MPKTRPGLFIGVGASAVDVGEEFRFSLLLVLLLLFRFAFRFAPWVRDVRLIRVRFGSRPLRGVAWTLSSGGGGGMIEAD